ncbi:MAG: class I lanthipeptide [Flavobacteriaceae bacterium]|nr:class I lanthipeptide [Flavobacteriaceae bacterium]
MSKLSLKKKTVTILTDEQKSTVNGGAGTTSYSGCTGFLCCNQQPCVPASMGTGNTCLMSGCKLL